MKWRGVRTFYILDGHEPVALSGDDAVLRWGKMYGEKDRRVAFTDLGFGTVSTVFLGIDHSFTGEGPPILFESMTFGNKKAGEAFPEELENLCQRYATWDEAERGHAEMVAEVREKFWKRRA